MPRMTEPQPTNHENQPMIVDEVVVLDLDRTLLNSSAVTQLVLESMALHGVSEDRIQEAIAYVEAQTGNSFHLFDYIERQFSIATLDEIVGELMQNEPLLHGRKNELLCAGADTLVYALEAQGTPAMLLTYGDQNYQSFKIDLFRKLIDRTNTQLPGIVTDVANKAMWVGENWFSRPDGLGEVPVKILKQIVLARMVSVVDDKISNLESTDERVVGVLVDNRTAITEGVLSTLELAEAVAGGMHIFEFADEREERVS